MDVSTKISLPEKVFIAIKKAFKKSFKSQDELWIFGSRADLTKKGSDIDLYIKTQYNDPKEITKAKMSFLNLIFMEIDEQKIDLVIHYPNSNYLEVYQTVKTQGIRIL